MTLGPAVRSDPVARRAKVGAFLLILGFLLMFWAWGSWLYRESVEHDAASDPQAVNIEIDETRESAVRALPRLLLVSSLLVIVVLFGCYAVIRFARRYKELVDRSRTKPTPSESVWEMHRLPDSWKDDSESEWRKRAP